MNREELQRAVKVLRERPHTYQWIARRLSITLSYAWALHNNPIPSELPPKCECGCGELVSWSHKKNCWNRFYGHHNSGNTHRREGYKLKEVRKRNLLRYYQLVGKLRQVKEEADQGRRNDLVKECIAITEEVVGNV